MVACVVIFFGVGVGIALWAALSGAEDLTAPWLVATLALPPAIELLYVMWVATAKGVGLATDFRLRFVRSDVGFGLRLFAVSMATAFVVVLVWLLFAEPPTAAAIDFAQDAEGGFGVGVVLFAILGATFIPVVEELVFRGLFWSALEKRGHRPVVILIVTSAVFSLLHLEPTRAPILFGIGLLLGVGRLRTGRIGASIVAHMSVNSLGMIALLADLA